MNPPDTEWLALEAGLKPGLRQTLGAQHLPGLERRVARAGFAMVMAARPVQFPGREPEEVAYVARTRAHAELLRDAEARVFPSPDPIPLTDAHLAAHAELGAALGFPRCCVDAFLTRLRRGVTTRARGGDAPEVFVAVEDALAATQAKPLGRLNHLLFERRVRFLSHYPCRYDCAESATYAGALFEETRRRVPADADAMRAMLCAPLALTLEGRVSDAANAPPGALVLDFSEF